MVRLTLRDAASQSLGLGNHRWDDCVRVLGDGAEDISRGRCDLLGCFLGYRQLLYVSLKWRTYCHGLRRGVFRSHSLCARDCFRDCVVACGRYLGCSRSGHDQCRRDLVVLAKTNQSGSRALPL